MNKNEVDIFIINRSDEFFNEYIAPYAERLKWISNFSGSAGKAIILKKKAYIFIDGRYTLQVLKEVNKRYFSIKHLKDYWTCLNENILKYDSIAIDPNLHSIFEVEKIIKITNTNKAKINFLEKNPIDIFWKNKPRYPFKLAFLHEYKYAGKKAETKIKNIQRLIKKESIDYYLITSLESIAWLLNLRGKDIDYNPLLICYAIVPRVGKVELFVDNRSA